MSVDNFQTWLLIDILIKFTSEIDRENKQNGSSVLFKRKDEYNGKIDNG